MIKRISTYAVVALLLFAGACKKNQSTPPKKDTKNPTTELHGTGAILDRKAFLDAPKADIEAIRAALKISGVKPKFETFVANKQQVNTINPDLSPPSSVVLLHPTPGNQGQTNTCVSWSIGYAAKQVLDLTWQNATADAGARSGWFLYNKIYASQGGCAAGDLPVAYGGNGLTSTDGLNYAKQYGIASATAQPSFAACSPAPSSAAINSAATDKPASYAAVTSYYTAKQLLAAGLPVYFAFGFYNDFETAFDNGTMWSTLNSPASSLGHAICLIGYDDAKAAFLAQNSWGTFGGDAAYPGCVWVSYSVVLNLLAQGRPSGGGEAYVLQPVSTTAVHLYYNTAKSGSFRPSCNAGVGTGMVTYTVPASQYSSAVSAAAADALAVNDVNTNGQTYANSHGTCTPTTIQVTLSKSGSITGNYSIQFSGAAGTFQFPFNNSTINLAAGIYQVGIFPIGGSTNSHSYSGSSCTMSYNGSGTSVTFNGVLLNCGGNGTFSIN